VRSSGAPLPPRRAALRHTHRDDVACVHAHGHRSQRPSTPACGFRRRTGKPEGEHRGTDGTVTDGPYPEAIGGLRVVDVASREEALKWAAKTAVACRCAQEVRKFMPDPTVGN
jgi:hypothetical protein